VEIDRGGVYGGVAEKLTDGVEIVSFVEKMSGETMAECMKAALFGYACFFFAAYITDDTAVFVMCESGFCPGKSQGPGEYFRQYSLSSQSSCSDSRV
jgi:hypothetical protein